MGTNRGAGHATVAPGLRKSIFEPRGAIAFHARRFAALKAVAASLRFRSERFSARLLFKRRVVPAARLSIISLP